MSEITVGVEEREGENFKRKLTFSM